MLAILPFIFIAASHPVRSRKTKNNKVTVLFAIYLPDTKLNNYKLT
jgi:hypothetical protein